MIGGVRNIERFLVNLERGAREMRPGHGRAPIGGGSEIGRNRERGRERRSEVGGKGFEPVHACIGLCEIDRVEPARDKDWHTPRSRERGGAGCKDRTVIENRGICRGEPESQLLVGQSFKTKRYVIQSRRELTAMRGIGRIAWLSDDGQRGFGPCRAPMRDNLFDLFVGLHGSKHQAEGLIFEPKLLHGFHTRYGCAEAGRQISVWDDVNAIRSHPVRFQDTIPRGRRVRDDPARRGEDGMHVLLAVKLGGTIVRPEIVRGEDQRVPAHGTRQVDRKACLAKPIEAIVAEWIVCFRPVQVEHVENAVFHKPRERQQALVVGKEINLDAEWCERFSEQGLVGHAFSPVRSKKNLHRVEKAGEERGKTQRMNCMWQKIS